MTIERREEVEGITAVMPLRASLAGGSGSFLVVGDDGRPYWCKSLNNFQGPRIPITEQTVGRLAPLIGAPACEVALVRLDALAGGELSAVAEFVDDRRAPVGARLRAMVS